MWMQGRYHTGLRLKRPATAKESDAHSLIRLTYAVCIHSLRLSVPDLRKRRVGLTFADSFAVSRQGLMQIGAVYSCWLMRIE
jgi:hypothetical protein